MIKSSFSSVKPAKKVDADSKLCSYLFQPMAKYLMAMDIGNTSSLQEIKVKETVENSIGCKLRYKRREDNAMLLERYREDIIKNSNAYKKSYRARYSVRNGIALENPASELKRLWGLYTATFCLVENDDLLITDEVVKVKQYKFVVGHTFASKGARPTAGIEIGEPDFLD
jgi:hypothetical protein